MAAEGGACAGLFSAYLAVRKDFRAFPLREVGELGRRIRPQQLHQSKGAVMGRRGCDTTNWGDRVALAIP